MEKYVPPFTITNDMVLLISSITENLGIINSLENLSKYPILRKQNRIKSIYSSCAIEANSLSLEDVTSLINGIKVKGPQNEIAEIQNAIKAYDEIENINPLKEKDLKKVHSILGKDVILDSGKYRTGNEGVSDEQGNVIFVAPPPEMVPILMSNLFTWISKEFNNISPLILSSVFHYEFVFIHPFSDGNGRVARYWQNALLGKWKNIFYWLPIENQIHKYQNDYYSTISKCHINGNSNEFIVFMLKMINETIINLVKNNNEQTFSNSIYLEKMQRNLSKNIWYTSNQILEKLHLKSKESLRKNYINPAIKCGLMIMEFPEKPTTKIQRYKIK